MKHILKFALSGFLVAGLQLSIRAETLKFTSPYSEEQVPIDYSFVFYSGADGDFSGTFGPRYTFYDLAARNEPPSAIVKLLEDRYQTLIKQNTKPVTSDSVVRLLFPTVMRGQFVLTPTRLSYSGYNGIGGILHDEEYAGNCFATAAAHGRLDVVKAIVEWVKQKLQQHSALDKLSVVLGAPALNFGVKKTKGCLIVGTALVFALLNEEYEIVQYLLDQGALPEGALVAKGLLSPGGDKKIAQISCPVNGLLFDLEDILIAKRILDAQAAGKLKLDPKLEVSLKVFEADRSKSIARQEQEKIDREKREKKDRENLELYLREQTEKEKTYRLEQLTSVLKESRAQLEDDRRGKQLVRDAAKAVWKYPEFFEKVLKERPDLADIIEDGAIRLAGAFDNYEQTPAEKMREREVDMRNRLAQIRKQVGAQEKPK